MKIHTDLWFGIISLFPEMFQALQFGITGRALKKGAIHIAHWNPRDFAEDKHQSVDDKPYGGGPGMVMMAKPLKEAISEAKKAAKTKPTVIYLSPQGKAFTQKTAGQLVNQSAVILIAGRYEGIDERIIEQEVDEEWSIGDYVLTGGELAAMVVIDAVTRLVPGILGDAESVQQDSLASGLLKYPQYTRPVDFETLQVPDILLSGHHGEIETWRLKQSLGKTWLKRPDLITKKELSDREMALLKEFIREYWDNRRALPKHDKTLEK